MIYSTQFMLNPKGARLALRWSLVGSLALAATLFNIWPQNAQAHEKGEASPGVLIFELYCHFGDGGVVGHDFEKGIIRAPYRNNTGRGTLQIYTARDKALIKSANPEGRPMLEYAIYDDEGESLIWGGSQAYTSDMSLDAKFISLGSVGGRMLRLNKLNKHFWKGGYTGVSGELDEGLFVTFTALTCTKAPK